MEVESNQLSCNMNEFIKDARVAPTDETYRALLSISEATVSHRE